ncbi:Magnesium transporter MgtE [Poriferisphaera corsica]|uniref:Magnesium transporter MgtE n=1 Tax=Poriferisphaera corsica TaxID=2528020 RepID=A0A517YVB5_9BACT|nr:CBS domain-containing protein [Poriferisphaera corsica]QDU34157.1 Magnesium transporter MgtE [Poriferisphaera corsica]
MGPDILDQPISTYMHEPQTVVCANETVRDAIQTLRQSKVEQTITYLYVVDNHEKSRLVGVLPTRRLLLADSDDTLLGDIMLTDVQQLDENTTMGEALRMFDAHKYLALPVINHNGRLLGVIDVGVFMDEVGDLDHMERLQESFQIIGMRVQQVEQGNALRGYALRMPWLFVNIAGGLICAAIATAFSEVLDKVVVLAAFIPLVLALNESISIQSLSISLQQIGTMRETIQRLIREFIKESKTAAMLALTSCLVVGIASIFWPGNHWPPIVIAFSILLSMVVTALYGLLIPKLLHALNLDPKVAAGPVVLMMADVTTLIVYLGIGTAILL